ncbi:MAG: hypothetical protein NTX50_03295 [Candidatus Sumerlaeota bacterium]|nr:hypothetical protein [Candidatus Sumerlaeota bacterium]
MEGDVDEGVDNGVDKGVDEGVDRDTGGRSVRAALAALSRSNLARRSIS